MAAPNIVGVTSIYGKSVGKALTGSSQDILTNSAGSGKVYKINAIYAANIDGANPADLTVTWYDASATATYNLAKTISVPADATLVVVDKEAALYLEEGDKISALASSSGDIEVTISYEDIA